MVFVGGLLWLAALLGGFFALGAMGWPGPPDDSVLGPENTWTNYCERCRANSMIKQPVNTWSNVGFMLVGLTIMGFLQAKSGATAPANPMLAPTFFAILYGCLVIFLGPGSMVYHASMSKLGGWLDNLSMDVFISFVLSYDVVRMAHSQWWLLVLLMLLVNVPIGIVTWLKDGTGKYFFGAVVGVTLLVDVIMVLILHVGGVHRDWPWLAVAGGVFAVGFVVWILSQSRRPLCDPDSFFQGHGVWHICSALTAGSIFLYMATEKLVP